MRRVLQCRTQIKKGCKDLYSTLEELIVIKVWWTIQGIRILAMHLGKFLDSLKFLSWESQLQDWSMLKNSRYSTHDAVHQRSWDSKVNWRTYDIAIDCGTKGFLRLRYAWFDDCVCIEEAHHENALSRKNEYRRAPSSKRDTIFTREANCLFDLRAFSCNRSLWCRARSIWYIQCTLAERWRSGFRNEMGTSSIISMWSTY